jgi:hypothetical protein
MSGRGAEKTFAVFEIPLDAGSGGKVTMSEAMAASERIWQASVQNGTDTMTMDEIDAEIAAARKERKARAGA